MWRLFGRNRKSRHNNGTNSAGSRPKERYGEDNADQILIANNTFVAAIPVLDASVSRVETPPKPRRRKIPFFPKRRHQERGSTQKNSIPEVTVTHGSLILGSDDPLGTRAEMETASEHAASARQIPQAAVTITSVASVPTCTASCRGLAQDADEKSKRASCDSPPSSTPSASIEAGTLLMQGELVARLPLQKSREIDQKKRTCSKDVLCNDDLDTRLEHLEVPHQIDEEEKSTELEKKKLALRMSCEDTRSIRTVSSESNKIERFLSEQLAAFEALQHRSPTFPARSAM